MDTRLALLARGLRQAFDARAWHGPNLTSAIAGLTETDAAWRPQSAHHNAWELIVHAAYWKYRVLRHVAADPPASFSEPGSNFFARPARGEAQEPRPLAEDIATLHDGHERLIAAAEAFDPARLDDIAYDRYSFEALLLGAAAHDVYHAGQIRLLRAMRSEA